MRVVCKMSRRDGHLKACASGDIDESCRGAVIAITFHTGPLMEHINRPSDDHKSLNASPFDGVSITGHPAFARKCHLKHISLFSLVSRSTARFLQFEGSLIYLLFSLYSCHFTPVLSVS